MGRDHTWSALLPPPPTPNFCGAHLVVFIVVEVESYGEHLKNCLLEEQCLHVQASNIRVNLATG